MNESLEIQAPLSLKIPIRIPHKIMMGPGPSNISPRVLHAMSNPVLGHLHTETGKLMDEVKEGIQYIFQTRNEMTLCVSASGHGGMEASFCNLVEPGDKVLILKNGIWGERAADIAKRSGGNTIVLEGSIGKSFTLQEIEESVNQTRPTILFVTHGESSTGVLQPLQGIGDICHRYNCLLIVDTVASLLGTPVFTDKWKIDVIYTGSQKVLGAPPGITPISFSPRAVEKIMNRKKPVSVYYFDVTMLGQYWKCEDKPRYYHHTIPVPLLYGLREALAIISEEGLHKCWKRHLECSTRLQNGIKSLGLELFVKNQTDVLPTVIAIKNPTNVKWQDIVQYAMKTHLVEIGGGLGPTVGQIMRLGVMGVNATNDTIDLVLNVLKEACNKCNL